MTGLTTVKPLNDAQFVFCTCIIQRKLTVPQHPCSDHTRWKQDDSD